VRRWLILALVLGCSVLVGACTNGDDENGAPAEDPVLKPEARDSARGGRVRLLRVGRFREPTYLTAPAGDRRHRFVVERAGRIRVLAGRRVLREPLLDIQSRVSTEGEGGLLSMAFAPNYASSRRFFIYYTDLSGDIRIEGYRTSASSPNRALPESRTQILRIDHDAPNHKGGQLQFGPDGMLYAGVGDGGGQGDPGRNGQDLSTLLGKLLRIDPLPGGGYRVPADNPFRNRAGARPEIFAYGLRNPWRFSFDRRRGHLTIGDVGQSAEEEVNFVPNRARGRRAPRGGQNFGWSVFEGFRRFRQGRAPGYVRPAIAYDRSRGECSVIGGYIIRDRTLPARLRGRYVYGDLCRSQLRLAALGKHRSRDLGLAVRTLISFGEDGRGRVYAMSQNGPVYRIGRG
jgi:glucose/arabinose dehydrogenase